MYTLNLNPNDLEIIGKALYELPYKESAPLIKKINDQIVEQTNKANTPKSNSEQ